MSLAPPTGRSPDPKTASVPRAWNRLLAARWLPECLSLAVVALSLFAALAAYAYRGWFSRYTADDYCTAGLQRVAGFVGAQVYWYEFWSGRMTYYFVAGVVEYGGSITAQVLPGLVLLAWLGTGAWALLPLAMHQRWPVPLLSAAVSSAALILVCLSGAPLLDQSLYWQTGMLTYLLPLVLMTAYAGWLAWRVRTRGARPATRFELLASAAYLIAAGGVSETSLVVQFALFALSVGCVGVLRRGPRHAATRVLLAVGLLATFISGIIVVAAPGNYVHEATITGTVHGLSQLPPALQASVDFAGLFARAVQFRARPAVLLLLALTLTCGFYARTDEHSRHTGREWPGYVVAALGVVVCGWLVLIAASFPGFYAQQRDPPERAQFVAVWVVAVVLALVGYLIGLAVGEVSQRLGTANTNRFFRALSCAVLLAGAVAPFSSIRDTIARVPADAVYAREWDQIDAILRAGTDAPIVLNHTLPAHFGFEFLGPDPNLYPNPCIARFYAVPSIRVAPDA